MAKDNRLCDVVLEVPPLRERREDIALLVEHFRTKFNAQYELSVGPPEPGALRALETAAWPGNVRELETHEPPKLSSSATGRRLPATTSCADPRALP